MGLREVFLRELGMGWWPSLSGSPDFDNRDEPKGSTSGIESDTEDIAVNGMANFKCRFLASILNTFVNDLKLFPFSAERQ